MSIIIFIIVLSILIVVHELGHFIIAKREGVRVEQFSLGFGPKILGWKRAGTEYIVCAIPLGGYVKLAGDNPDEAKGRPDEYLSKSPGQRARIVFFGPLLNYTLAFLCFWLVFILGVQNLATRVGGVIDNFGAQESGISVGDKILAIDGQPVKIWQELQGIIQAKQDGDVVSLLVLRKDRTLEIPVKIKQERVDTIWGEQESVGLIGISPADEFITVRYGLLESFYMGGKQLFYLTGVTLKSLIWMASGKISFRNSVTGPLGIFYITKEAADIGMVALIQVIAIISMNLTILNLLPLPVLDGGHILFLLIERIRGRRLSSKTERMITQVGFSIIIILVVFVFYNDFLKYGVFDKILQFWSR